MHFQINRNYVRTDDMVVTAKVSEDAKNWFSASVPNIAAAGLLFLSEKAYKEGDLLWLDLDVNPRLPEMIEHFHVKTKALVKNVRKEQDKMNSYGVVFTEISENDRIRLDEMIRLKLSKSSGFLVDDDSDV